MYNETLLAMGLFAERSLYRGNLTKRERFCLPACTIKLSKPKQGKKICRPITVSGTGAEPFI